MTITALAPGDLAIDRALAQVSESYRFLLDLTPVDVEAHRDAFLDGRAGEPAFTYRPLEDDPDVIAAVLDEIAVGDVEDPTLGHLLRAKHREVGLQLDMLRARGTDEFLPLSIELYGSVAPWLLARAVRILDSVEDPARGGHGDRIGAARFVELAEAELAHYRTIDPDIGVHAEIRTDASGIMVSGRDLIVGSAASVPVSRAHALLQHEIGTHLVTYLNGAHQPIRVMAAGLAGHEETQEGLAVLAEFLVGGLSPYRLRQLAARVVAVHGMVSGDTFGAVHHGLVVAGFSPSSAFTTTMRAFRSGGLTKDAIYLRGLLDLLGHLVSGGTLDLFWLGKLSLDDLPLVGELADRGVLAEPRFIPRYLADPAVASRLERAARLTDPTELIGTSP
ncbi:MAG TPA: tyrosine/phenylalanine carboxypeptidase domain-containing protein [Acidimicrobiales bacterium]|nr:tyrosine/phenylalanine carboxypeptidase domain-containing protein [Acidimicrobiales bacterium]